ncbi:hypothetical protein OIE66_24625 [Nonomuraea sp. NBC_01738]|uniref:hypothetical protein n=1 Tax=Nonomuraea sp. NBC_01738 TaxID=2976003 RepID=UPI002E1387D9|nr:hypothetical protein OIE66_24625 [Nonomuraea sp. NBC_01738]
MRVAVAVAGVLVLGACGAQAVPQGRSPASLQETRQAHQPGPPAVALIPLTEKAGPMTVTGKVAHTTGGASAAITEKVNEQLAAPVYQRLREYSIQLQATPTVPATATVNAGLRLATARYASVRYDIEADSTALSHPTWNRARALTVDLRTGDRVGAADVFQGRWLSGKGLRELGPRLVDGFHGRSCLARSGGAGTLKIRSVGELGGPQVQFALLKDGLEVIVDAALYGYETACGQPSARIPYAELTDVVLPSLVADLG